MKFTNNLLIVFSMFSSVSLILLLLFLNTQAKNHAKTIKKLENSKNKLEEQNRAAKISLENINKEIKEKKELSQSQLTQIKEELNNTEKTLEKLVAVGPRPTCGDPDPKDILPAGVNVKINWYPVYVSYERKNEILRHFCNDAFMMSSIDKVQVASFWTKERAKEYANWIRGEVGKPKRNN